MVGDEDIPLHPGAPADDEDSGAAADEPIWLAWDGWQMRIPADWRPHEIDCLVRRRRMFIGPADHAAAKLEWWRPGQRQRNVLPPERVARTEDAADESFADVRAAGELKGAGKSFWYGYAARANLVLQITVDERSDPAARDAIHEVCLPTLSASGPGRATRWSIYSASFVSPAGFRYAAHRLEAGHVALRFAGGGQRLVVRQIYPATLALGKRPLAGWLRPRSFAERRTYQPIGEPVPWRVTVRGRELHGLLQPAYKSFGAPFHRIARRRAVTAAAVDPRLDRILMAELDSPGEPDERVLADAIAAMNWAAEPQRSDEGS